MSITHPRTCLLHRIVGAAAAALLVASGGVVAADLVDRPAPPRPTAATDDAVRPAAAAPTAAAQDPGPVHAPVTARPVVTDGVGGSGPDCPDDFTASPAGCLREVAPGQSEVAQPDGEVVTIATPHGLEAGHDDHDADDGTFAAGTGSWNLDDVGRRPVACAPRGTPRTVAIYAHQGDAGDPAAVRRSIRSVVERSNALVADSARASGGPVADLRLACTSGGAVSVRTVAVPGARYGQIRQAVVDAGHDAAHEKYLVFTDQASPDPSVSGMAQRYADDRRTEDNHNNGVATMVGVVWDPHWDGIVPLHELTHLMGGVQADAPGSDGSGHCTDSRDVMCSTYERTHCADWAYDCGHDTYFSTAPADGSYLATHWNIGWAGNRFVDVAGQEPDPEPEPEPTEPDQPEEPADDDDRATDEPDAPGDETGAGELVEAVTGTAGAVVDTVPVEEAGALVGEAAGAATGTVTGLLGGG